ncbi:MAG: TetR/AcrR family transcriptional regulator [Nevskiales bacterium]
MRITLKPRKAPRQNRAQETVEAILQATAQLLDEVGYASLSTNHVAQKAGVSIGSLYQYFPNKEAICAALAERHYQRHAQRYLQRLREVAAEPVKAQVRALVRASFEVAREDPALAKNLYAELSRIGGFDPLRRMRETIERELTLIYQALPRPLRPQHPDMVAFIVTVACGQLLGDVVLRKPQWLKNEAFLDQVCELVLGYYQRLGWLAT